MAFIEVRLPALGEGIVEATITRWLVKPGEKVNIDTPLVEIATDKVDTEVMSPAEGTVSEILLPEQAVPKVGQVLLRILGGRENEPHSPEVNSFAEEAETVTMNKFQEAIQPAVPVHAFREQRFIPPFIRTLAIAEGISPAELADMPGSGQNGQLTKEDILTFVLQKSKGTPLKKVLKETMITDETPQQEIVPGPGETVIPMDRVRKLIARNMAESKRIAPHVTVFSEVDVTPIAEWREKIKLKFRERYSENLTFTPVFMEVVARALLDFPGINISVKDDFIIRKSFINIGMAVALPDGNLIVPVIKNADKLNLPELARQVNDLSQRARSGKLKPAEIQDGTFSITNIGSFGNISGTPIINQPQVAILAIGTITKKPAAVNINGTLGIGLRDMLTLSLAFDHRAVDGALGGNFLQRVCQYLSDFDIHREI